MLPRLDRQATSCPTSPPRFASPLFSTTPTLGLAPPAVECIRPQNGSSAAAVAHGEKPDRPSSCWAETGQGHSLNEILALLPAKTLCGAGIIPQFQMRGVRIIISGEVVPTKCIFHSTFHAVVEIVLSVSASAAIVPSVIPLNQTNVT